MSLNRPTTRILYAEDADGKLFCFITLQVVPHAEPLLVAPSMRATGLAGELADQMLGLLLDMKTRGWIVVADNPIPAKLCEARGRDCVPHAKEVYNVGSVYRSVIRVWGIFIGGVALGGVLLLSFRFREYVFPPPPSYSVAVLGVLAVVMTLVLPKEPSRGQKAAWMLGAFALMVLEMWAVSHDRKEQETRFSAIASELTTAIEESKATLKKAQQNLETTEQVGKLAQENLENITGGESFAYLTPQIGFTPMPVSIYNYGKNPLTGVVVSIYPPTQSFDDFLNSVLKPTEIEVGTLHPGILKILKYNIDPNLTKSELREFRVEISAQNFTVTQYIWFKRGVHNPWLYKTLVQRQFVKAKVGKTTYFGYKTLFQRDWSKD